VSRSLGVWVHKYFRMSGRLTKSLLINYLHMPKHISPLERLIVLLYHPTRVLVKHFVFDKSFVSIEVQNYFQSGHK
jgi:hypothetical protein